ncbi:MAG: septation protein A [Methylophilaceae bacterium]|uniref:septation protein A n=1 Tax=Methylovorus sp. MM2 TaxID=1848038 RepID=UPI0007DFC792|nr:septation protein A [Methylovorus sp. MM2]OAM52618.1 septation protein A [Methylovorus sp. MM2]
MKFLFDLFPVIAFFITYKLTAQPGGNNACIISANSDISILHQPILLATAVAIAATFLQVGWLVFRRKKVDTMLWISLIIIVVFGGATIYFHNPSFIQLKPTILYWVFAFSLAFSALVFKKNLIRNVMGSQLSFPDKVWNSLNYAWICFFIALGVINIIAAKILSCDGWVNFKVYGFTGIMFVFIVGQMLFLSKYMTTTEDSK